MPAPYCTNCQHMQRSQDFPENLAYARCGSPQNIRVGDGMAFVSPDPVPPSRLIEYCDNARSTEAFCGPTGKWFEPKIQVVRDNG